MLGFWSSGTYFVIFILFAELGWPTSYTADIAWSDWWSFDTDITWSCVRSWLSQGGWRVRSWAYDTDTFGQVCGLWSHSISPIGISSYFQRGPFTVPGDQNVVHTPSSHSPKSCLIFGGNFHDVGSRLQALQWSNGSEVYLWWQRALRGRGGGDMRSSCLKRLIAVI